MNSQEQLQVRVVLQATIQRAVESGMEPAQAYGQLQQELGNHGSICFDDFVFNEETATIQCASIEKRARDVVERSIQ